MAACDARLPAGFCTCHHTEHVAVHVHKDTPLRGSPWIACSKSDQGRAARPPGRLCEIAPRAIASCKVELCEIVFTRRWGECTRSGPAQARCCTYAADALFGARHKACAAGEARCVRCARRRDLAGRCAAQLSSMLRVAHLMGKRVGTSLRCVARETSQAQQLNTT